MLRHRISAHLKRQDWLAIAIDFVIVVAGVFVGIQVSNWNDGLKDRRAADGYLARIADDLRSDMRELDRREVYWRTTAEAGDRALRFAEEGVIDGSQWDVLNDLYGAGQLWTYSSNDATYRELVGAGRLELVRDVNLRRRLADYYVGKRTQASMLFETLPAYREDIRGAVPYRLQRYILEHCQQGLGTGFRATRCPPPEAPADYRPVVRSITGDEQLMSELRTWMTTLRYIRAVGRQHYGIASTMAAEIDAERR